MTLFTLFAILCVLIVIARELRFLRKQREAPPSIAKRHTGGYKPRIFTFNRSGWSLRIVDLDEWVTAVIAVAIWFKFVMPLLPTQPWIKYAITILGLVVSFVVLEFLLVIFVSGPIGNLMQKYDDRVYGRVFSADERKHIENPSADSSGVEEMHRHKGL